MGFKACREDEDVCGLLRRKSKSILPDGGDREKGIKIFNNH
jgi:hypothetical protein